MDGKRDAKELASCAEACMAPGAQGMALIRSCLYDTVGPVCATCDTAEWLAAHCGKVWSETSVERIFESS